MQVIDIFTIIIYNSWELLNGRNELKNHYLGVMTNFGENFNLINFY